jgi:hypothetical protein
MSTVITPADIEAKFGTPAGVTAFPNFCNTVIVSAGLAVSSFPSLSDKPGPDGGKDGEWLLTDDEAIARWPFTSVGWNVFQFKASGFGAKGRNAAISELNRKLDRAVRKLVDRQEGPAYPLITLRLRICNWTSRRRWLRQLAHEFRQTLKH